MSRSSMPCRMSVLVFVFFMAFLSVNDREEDTGVPVGCQQVFGEI